MLCVLIVEGISVVVNVMLSLMSVMSQILRPIRPDIYNNPHLFFSPSSSSKG